METICPICEQVVRPVPEKPGWWQIPLTKARLLRIFMTLALTGIFWTILWALVFGITSFVWAHNTYLYSIAR